MKFYVEPDGHFYKASWDDIPIIEGTGETPMKAIEDLKRKLNDVLCDKDTLAKIGREIIRIVLAEMAEW